MSSSQLINSGTYGDVFLVNPHEVQKIMTMANEDTDPVTPNVIECSFISTFSHIPFIPNHSSINLSGNKIYLNETNMGMDLHKYIIQTPYEQRIAMLPSLMSQMGRILLWMKQIHVAHMDIKPKICALIMMVDYH
jgi:hypothetical protein